MVSKKGSSPDSLAELRGSCVPIAAGLAAAAVMVFFVGDASAVLVERARLFSVTLLLLAAAAGLLALWNWRPDVARWTAVAVPVALLLLAAIWFRAPQWLILLGVPIALAAVLVGARAALLLALAETVLLVTTVQVLAARPVLVPALAGIWAMSGVMTMLYQPVHRVARWASEQYSTGQQRQLEAQESQAELRHAISEIEQANRQLALATERTVALRLIAEEAERNKAEFVAQVSHEFRTPLNMIIGLVGIMVDRPETYAEELPPDLERDLRIVNRNCEHLASMVNDVLDLSRAEAGRLVLHKDYVGLGEIVESALAVVRPLIEKKSLRLQVSIPNDLPRLHCDRVRIRQVILNLLSNAARFTEEGYIMISAIEQKSSVVVSVSDTGHGIAPEEIAAVFEPFTQSPSGRLSDGGGTGLGLSISRRFVALHGGRMWLESTVGVGSTFSFELPLTQQADRTARPGHLIKEDWVWREQSFRTDGVLRTDELTRPRVVVYDETSGLTPHLPRHSNEVEFVRVTDLRHIAEELRAYPANALVLNAAIDRLLPLVAEAGRHVPDTPIVGCSIASPDERIREMGAQGYLIKPVSREDLKQVMEAVGRPVRRVLVVDDDPDVLDLLARMLYLCDPSLDVSVAPDASQAIAALRATRPDLILLDMIMPDVNGLELLNRMRQEAGAEEVPVVFVSARDPFDRPSASPVVVGTRSGGIPIGRLLRWSLDFSRLLLDPEEAPGLAPAEIART